MMKVDEERKYKYLLDLFLFEYFSIVQTLAQDYPVENDRIIIGREVFKKALDKYAYMTVAGKIKAYKDLNFIIHDKNNYTMPVRDTEQNKLVRKVIINYRAYKTIKHLYETVANV